MLMDPILESTAHQHQPASDPPPLCLLPLPASHCLCHPPTRRDGDVDSGVVAPDARRRPDVVGPADHRARLETTQHGVDRPEFHSARATEGEPSGHRHGRGAVWQEVDNAIHGVHGEARRAHRHVIVGHISYEDAVRREGPDVIDGLGGRGRSGADSGRGGGGDRCGGCSQHSLSHLEVARPRLQETMRV